MKKIIQSHFYSTSHLGRMCQIRKCVFVFVSLFLFSLSSQAQIDLYPTEPSASPTIVSSGETISLSNILRNGGSSYSGYVYTGYYFSLDSVYSNNDVYLGSTSSTVYGSSKTYEYTNLTIPSSTKPGAYYVLFKADYNGYASETNELNNTVGVKITVSTPMIDLMITNLTTNPSELSAGAYFTVSNTLNNKGETSSGYSYTGYYLSADTILDANVDVLLNYYSDSYTVKGKSSVEQRASLYIPSAVKIGTMYLIASADYSSLVTETNEINNSSYVPITISKPDLILKNAALTSTSVSAGGTTKAAVFLTNQGAAGASSTSTGFYLSLDTIFNKSSDIYLSNSYSSALTSGETAAQSSTLSIPATQNPGTYYVLFVADYDFSVDEKNEKNNISYISITVTKNDVDLQIVNPYSSLTELSPGSSFEVSNYLKNVGKSNAGSSYTGYYLSKDVSFNSDEDIFLGSSNVYSLSPNSSEGQYPSLYMPSTVEDGSYFIFFVADYRDFISETNEDNNITSIPVTVGKADLVVTNLVLGSSNVEAGNSLRVYSFVKNIGTASSERSYLGYYLSSDSIFDSKDTYLDYAYSYQISPSEYDLLDKSLSVPTNVKPGNYYLILFADYDNSNVETNEKNNYTSVKVTVSAPNIDLIIPNASISDNNVSSNEYLTITSTLKNIGKSTAYQNYTGYYISKDTIFDPSVDTYIGSDYVYSLSGGSSEEQSQGYYIPGSLTNGKYYVLVIADYSEDISELNEKNNFFALPIEITPPNVDLIITNASVVESASPDSYIYVSNTLSNIGTSVASSSYTGYYLSKDTTFNMSLDTYLGSAYSYSVYGGSSSTQGQSVYIPAKVKAGSYYVLFIANYDNSISELNSTNNVKYKAINLTAPFIDLTVSSMTLADSIKAAGSSLRVYNSINNLGTSYSSSSYTGYYLSKDRTLDNGDVYLTSAYSYGIYAGGIQTQESYFSIPSSTTVGDYYILAVADYSDGIEEQNENNNVKAVFLKISEPFTDVTIEFSFLTKAYLEPGESVEGYNDLFNKGTTDIKEIITSYYLSKDTTFDMADTYLADQNLYLAAGSQEYQYKTLNIPSSMALGTYYVLFIADEKNLISESNENNNIRFQKIVLIKDNSKGDLTVADASVEAFSMKPGNSYSVGTYLANIGSADIAGGTTGYFLSNDSNYDTLDIYIGSITSDLVVAGQGNYQDGEIFIPTWIELGRYYLLSVADYQNTVDEVNELNNAFSSRVIIDVVSGLNDSQSSAEITVFPSPATDYVKVNLPGIMETEVEYSLVTALGVTVKTGTINGAQGVETTIDLSELTSGLYTLVLNNGKKKYYKSFTKM